MKLRFLGTCKDRYTNETYHINGVYEFEEERANEILKSGYVEVYEEPQGEPDEDEPGNEQEDDEFISADDGKSQENGNEDDPQGNDVDEDESGNEPDEDEPENADDALENGYTVNLHELSKEKLIKIAKKVNVATRGSKEDIIERILAAKAK